MWKEVVGTQFEGVVVVVLVLVLVVGAAAVMDGQKMKLMGRNDTKSLEKPGENETGKKK
jgi:hypothetical protein